MVEMVFPAPSRNVEQFDPVSVKRVLYLVDFNAYEILPSFRSTGYQRFFSPYMKWLIWLHNLPTLSYLNLADIWYGQLHNPREDSGVLYPRQAINTRYLELYVQSKIYVELRKLAIRNPQSSRGMENLLRHVRISDIAEYFPLNIFYELLRNMYLFHNDSALVVNLVKTACEIQSFENFISHIPPELLRFILRNCNRARFNLRHFILESIGVNSDPIIQFFPLVDYLLKLNPSFLEIFIIHGFQWNDYTSPEGIIHRASLWETGLPNSERGLHRQYLIIETVYIIHTFCDERTNLQFSLNWYHCGHLFFRSIPDPLITKNELSTALMNYPGDIVRRLVSASEKHFFKIIAENYEPRTLEHLCRYVIRLALWESFQLPHGIYKLKLPSKISSYLRLQS